MAPKNSRDTEPRDLHKTNPVSRSVIRYVLGSLLALVALNAFAGGYYGMTGAKGIPTEWLKGTPFRDYFIPSLILLVGVGGASLIAAIAVFARLRMARLAAFSAVAILFVWLTAQIAIIGYVSWLQPAIALVGVIIFIFTLVSSRPTKRNR